jgi:ABC-type transport system involved in multi-copper enzyme maturation permease subunit
MKPYLAVITDSFRAAFSSRILWILLLLITLFLIVLAPLALDPVPHRFSDSDARDALQIRYGGQDFGYPVPIPGQSPEQLTSIAVAWFLDYIVDFIVGVFGVFVALVVTSSIIPETYKRGSVELLLSKPVRRPFLFLAKFTGACAFVFLNLLYLLVGIWLIVGLRLGFWEVRLLVAIPVFLFYFVIFYCVSALTGLIWRNAILSLTLTLVFWGACIVVAQSKTVMEKFFAAEKFVVSPEAEAERDQAGREFWRSIYDYGVLPLYTIFPKPLELDNTVQYLFNREQGTAAYAKLIGSRDPPALRDPFAPVISSAIFVAVVLGIGCFISYRAEY